MGKASRRKRDKIDWTKFPILPKNLYTKEEMEKKLQTAISLPSEPSDGWAPPIPKTKFIEVSPNVWVPVSYFETEKV